MQSNWGEGWYDIFSLGDMKITSYADMWSYQTLKIQEPICSRFCAVNT